jgi:AraC family transcriptional activator of tynA and feaB
MPTASRSQIGLIRQNWPEPANSLAFFRSLKILRHLRCLLHWRINRALELVETAPSDPELDAQTIADDLGINQRRLDQVFLEALDTTVSFQISERRLTFAASSLCDPARAKDSVTNIAFLSGFHDGAHFSRTFKNRFGVSPREFRKQAMTE